MRFLSINSLLVVSTIYDGAMATTHILQQDDIRTRDRLSSLEMELGKPQTLESLVKLRDELKGLVTGADVHLTDRKRRNIAEIDAMIIAERLSVSKRHFDEYDANKGEYFAKYPLQNIRKWLSDHYTEGDDALTERKTKYIEEIRIAGIEQSKKAFEEIKKSSDWHGLIKIDTYGDADLERNLSEFILTSFENADNIFDLKQTFPDRGPLWDLYFEDMEFKQTLLALVKPNGDADMVERKQKLEDKYKTSAQLYSEEIDREMKRAGEIAMYANPSREY